jgi:hypothetical protein
LGFQKGKKLNFNLKENPYILSSVDFLKFKEELHAPKVSAKNDIGIKAAFNGLVTNIYQLK